MINTDVILHPINLDSKSMATVVTALEAAKLFGSKIHLLYVNDEQAGYRHPIDHEDAVALKVKEAAPAGLLDQLEVTYAVARGTLDKEVAAYCGKHGITMIVVGHRHRTKIYSSLFDSPDENIIDAIKLPVLVIPED
jgi:nucleotide-binding universal stress UspA family protein